MTLALDITYLVAVCVVAWLIGLGLRWFIAAGPSIAARFHRHNPEWIIGAVVVIFIAAILTADRYHLFGKEGGIIHQTPEQAEECEKRADYCVDVFDWGPVCEA